MKATVPNNDNIFTIAIKSNGALINDDYLLLSAYVDRSVNERPYCRIDFMERNTFGDQFSISDSKTFSPGAEIELLAGYKQSNTSVFKGVVEDHSLKFTTEGGSVLTILCRESDMIKPSKKAAKGAIELKYGENILAFEAKVTGQQLSVSTASSPPYLNTHGVVKFEGNALAKPDTLISIRGVGKRFSGSNYVSGIIHDIKDGNWITTAKLGPLSKNDNNKEQSTITNDLQSRVRFDEEKKEIIIDTPNGNKLVLSDEEESITLMDQNSNFIKLSSEGIEINSASDVRITAAESVTIEGPSGITASASGGEISISGMTVSCNADTEFSASGDASASLTSSAEVAITGAMVLINS